MVMSPKRDIIVSNIESDFLIPFKKNTAGRTKERFNAQRQWTLLTIYFRKDQVLNSRALKY